MLCCVMLCAAQIMEETGQQAQQRAPPASKELVASLPRERLTAERLQQLGGPDVCCPVCRWAAVRAAVVGAVGS